MPMEIPATRSMNVGACWAAVRPSTASSQIAAHPKTMTAGSSASPARGLDDVLPFLRKLEFDVDFQGELHGQDGPVPIRRILPDM